MSTHLLDDLRPKTLAISRMVGVMEPTLKSKVLVPLFQKRRDIDRNSCSIGVVVLDIMISL